MVKKFPVVILAFAMIIMVLLACARPAYATEKYKPKVYPIATEKILNPKFEFNKNLTYVEVCSGVVADKHGNGHVIGNKDLYISYKYKNHPPKGTKVYSLFQLDSNWDHEALNRKDFVIDENGVMKEIHKSY